MPDLARHVRQVCIAGGVLLLAALAPLPARASCNHASPSYSSAGESLLSDSLALLAVSEENTQPKQQSPGQPAPLPCFRCGSHSDGLPATVLTWNQLTDLFAGRAVDPVVAPWRFAWDEPASPYSLLFVHLLERPPRPV